MLVPTTLTLLAPAVCAPLDAAGGALQDEGLTDEAYRFRISPPADWKVLDTEAARRLHPEALAMVLTAGEEGAVVLAERLTGVPLEDAARALADLTLGESGELESLASTTFAGQDAWRFHGTSVEMGFPATVVAHVYRKGDHVLQVVAYGRASEVAPGSAFLEQLAGAFEVLEGDVDPPRDRRAARDSAGPGWDHSAGRFRSCAFGHDFRFGEDWRVMVGDELRAASPDAEVGFQLRGLEVYGVVIGERVGARHVEDHLAASRARQAARMRRLEATVTVPFHGAPLVLQGYQDDGDVPFVFFHGMRADGDVVHSLLVWGFAGDQQRIEAALASPPTFGRLSERERTAWDARLAAGSDDEFALNAAQSLRRGWFRDHGAGIGWRKPAGIWRTRLGQSAGIDPSFRLSIDNPRLGLYGTVLAGPWDGDLAGSHRAIVESYVGPEAAPADPREIAGTPVLHTRATDGQGYAYRFLSAVVDGVGYDVVLVATEASMEDGEVAATEALGAFRFGPDVAPAVSTEGDRHLEHRLGFGLTRPDATWTLEAEDLPRTRGMGRHARAERERDAIFAAAVPFVPGSDLDELRASLGKQVGGLLLGDPETFEGTFLGRPAIGHRYRDGRVEMRFVVRDGTLFVFGVSSRSRDLGLEQVTAGFSLLD